MLAGLHLKHVMSRQRTLSAPSMLVGESRREPGKSRAVFSSMESLWRMPKELHGS